MLIEFITNRNSVTKPYYSVKIIHKLYTNYTQIINYNLRDLYYIFSLYFIVIINYLRDLY